MRLHFVRVPVDDSSLEENRLNRFLAGHRILSIERHLVIDGERTAWALCIAYDEHAGDAARGQPAMAGEGTGKKGKVDYRDVLSPEQFDVFVRLRALRKQLAERDAIPLYAVFTNEQLAAIVRTQARTLPDLGRIDGVGPARVDKYGQAVLDLLAAPAEAAAELASEDT